MADFELPGYVQNPHARRRDCIAISAAYSYATNPRNLESPWYGPWSGVLHNLIADLPSAMVIPQFSIWALKNSPTSDTGSEHGSDPEDSPGPEDRPGSEDGPDTEDGPDPDGSEPDGSEFEDGPNCELQVDTEAKLGGSISDNESILPRDLMETQDDSTQPTTDDDPQVYTVKVPLSRATTCVPDFALVLGEGEQVDDDSVPDYCDGINVNNLKVAAIVENKAYVSRALVIGSEAYEHSLLLALGEAQLGLLRQAAHLFLNYPSHHEVIAIAAAGPEWTYAMLRREHVRREMYVIEDRDPAYNFRTHADSTPSWGLSARLGSRDSNASFRWIHSYLRRGARKGTVQLL